jgi:YceI-like domain
MAPRRRRSLRRDCEGCRRLSGFGSSRFKVSNDKLRGEHDGQIDAEEDADRDRPCMGHPTGGGGGLRRAGVGLGVVVPTADGATVTGNFTLHGVTKPVVLNVRFVGAGVNPIDKAYSVGFEATGTIKRSDFGVTTYVPVVGDEVQLTIAGAFEQQS